MTDAFRHLDRRLSAVRPLLEEPRPAKGWVRAIRNALGMTTQQLARRLGVSQSRIPELEQAEVSGSITLKSLERAAEAMGCRVLYTIVPERSLADAVRARAERIAARTLDAVSQSMKLEDQTVDDDEVLRAQRDTLVEHLMRHPARLWDEE